jgi:hypothetical protein
MKDQARFPVLVAVTPEQAKLGRRNSTENATADATLGRGRRYADKYRNDRKLHGVASPSARNVPRRKPPRDRALAAMCVETWRVISSDVR